MSEISDVDAYLALLAAERCWMLAKKSPDKIIRDLWQRDGDEAWKTVETWQRQDAGRRALAEAEGK